MTAQEFVEKAPLYTRVEIEDFSPPSSVTRMCSQPSCRKETTWLQSSTAEIAFKELSPAIRFKSAGYMCVLCRQASFAIAYELLNWVENPKSPYSPKHWHHTAVRKIGQIPPQEIELPAEMNDRLGSTAGHYKKALICRGQNYGIGAMAYLRRVIDEKTDDLIDVMAELSEAYNVPGGKIEKLLEAKKEVRYEEKLKIASELIPDAIQPSGVNPLGQLYRHTSIGLHGKTDDECVAIFDDLKDDFEYIFRNLHLQAEEQRQFVKRVQQRAGSS